MKEVCNNFYISPLPLFHPTDSENMEDLLPVENIPESETYWLRRNVFFDDSLHAPIGL